MAAQTDNPLHGLTLADLFAVRYIMADARLVNTALDTAVQEEIADRLMELHGQVVRWKRTGNAADAGANAAPSAPVPPPPTARTQSAHGPKAGIPGAPPPMPPSVPPPPPPREQPPTRRMA